MTDYSNAASAKNQVPQNYKFDTIPSKYKHLVVVWEYPEFQSLCPVSERHDQGTVLIKYKPGKSLLESKSMRDYLSLWRTMQNWQEFITEEIAEAVNNAIEPEWLLVEIRWAPRGGIFARTIASRGNVPEKYDACSAC